MLDGAARDIDALRDLDVPAFAHASTPAGPHKRGPFRLLEPIAADDIVQTPPGVTHGVTNTGADVLVYLSITTPPEDFSSFYSPSAPAGWSGQSGLGSTTRPSRP